ncbi:hypothetical protein CSC65_08460 [Pseudoxanthomonas daejeonensis]|uniref:Uncharacterized protein n=2 Tax=Pseudoxanthomonas daejeonensis TaxID=266062 RepID=A0ABQ6Z850_9GAMM|nr:hypothetical protein CSC65_08460 [Pseudoxanthomonas daejeonensis]
MAHYVAELMVRAQHAPLPEREDAQRACALAILDLWAVARAFPAKKAAFESIDQVIEAMASLHPEGGPRYRNSLWHGLDARASCGDSEVQSLLTTASEIDAAARNLIHYILAHASRIAGQDCADWLELAQHLDDDDPVTQLRIRIVRTGRDEAELKHHRIEQVQKRISQLDQLASATQALKTSLVESLAAASEMLDQRFSEPKA